MNNSIQSLFNLAGKRAVITGGAGFLGRQHAAALLELGAEVVLWDFSEKNLQLALGELSPTYAGKVSGVQLDISQLEKVQLEAKKLSQDGKGLHILINNAGMTVAQGEEKFKRYFDRFEDYPLELWQMAISMNLTSTFIVTQALAPILKQSKPSSIINIASDVGVISPDHRIYQPNPAHNYGGVHFNSPLSYATSKAALIHMTKFWATYWAKEGIRVNAISPAGVENSQDPAFRRELEERIPLGRMAKPHELKGAIAYLASEASSFTTGHNLIVDGGRTIW